MILTNSFFLDRIITYLVDPLLFVGQANSSVCQRHQSVLPDWTTKIEKHFQFVKHFVKKIGNLDFTTNVVNLFLVAGDGFEPPT